MLSFGHISPQHQKERNEKLHFALKNKKIFGIVIFFNVWIFNLMGNSL